MSTEIDPKVKALVARHQTLRTGRTDYDTLFQELKDLVRPDTTDFFGATNPGQEARRRIFDGTAPWALEQLASGLHSYLTNPVDRWAGIIVEGEPYDILEFDAKGWLEQVSDILYAKYSDPYTALNQSLHECYMDLAGLGTGVIYQWFDVEKMRLMFRAYPLADCWIEESSSGQVNELHRAVRWTVRQLREEFGSLPEKVAKMGDDDKVTVVHAVYPNSQYEPGSYHRGKRAFVSCYFVKDTSEELSSHGYDYFPYHVPRWTKLAGEKYGRGPALSVLPDIRMVNAMSKTLIVAAQKMADPALQIPDDGFLLPLRTMPGGLNFKRPGAEHIEPMPTAQRVDITMEMIEQRRDSIRRGFYVDWLVRPVKKERQTAQEIMDDRNQMLAMIAPVVGRLHSELIGPLVRLSYALLWRHGQLPEPPASMQGRVLDITFLSPAAKAQATVRGQGLQAYVSQIVQLLPVMPGLIDSINENGLNAELQDLTDVPRRVLNTPEVTAQKAAARQQENQMAQASQAAPAMAGAAKDLALAKQAGLPMDI